jgi:hypothetical protein
MLHANTSAWGLKELAAIAPTVAPNQACLISKVVIGAQYALGSRLLLSAPNAAKTGHRSHSDRSPLSSAPVRVATKLTPVFCCDYALA